MEFWFFVFYDLQFIVLYSAQLFVNLLKLNGYVMHQQV